MAIDDAKISACDITETATCSDGIQNGDETGIDCGGSQCADCPETFVRGDKRYELTNHLGNVMAVISDRRFSLTGDEEDPRYRAYTLNASEYYPFGLEMEGRTFNFGDYRFGFNGKEADSDGEWGGEYGDSEFRQTHYDYGFRIYNPSIARFLSVDPLAPDYPWYTPYQFAGNRPIVFIDLDGLEEIDPRVIPKGIEHISEAVVPEAIVNWNSPVSGIGPYTLFGAKGSNGAQFWYAAVVEETVIHNGVLMGSDYSYRIDWVVGVESFGEFVQSADQFLMENAEIELDIARDQLLSHMFPSHNGDVWEAYKSTWNPTNVATGLSLGLGGVVAAGGRGALRQTLSATDDAARNTVRANKIAGDSAADFAKNTYGGVREASFATTQGRRYIDVFDTPSGTAREVKVGRTSLSSRIRRQVLKDVELMNNPTSGVKSVEWHFYQSKTSGKIGPTGSLRTFLNENNIRVIEHTNISF